MAFLVTVNIPSITGVPADSISNQWAIAGGDPAQSDSYQRALQAVIDFYAATNAVTGSSLGEYLSGTLSRSADACEVNVYDITNDLDGSPHGSPLAADTFTLAANGASPALPSEVAAVLRLEAIGRATALTESPDGADAGTAVDRPKQRRTGRVYIGPLAQTSLTVVSGVPRISAGLRTQLLQGALAMNAYLIAGAYGEALGVWSRKDESVRAIESVAVDNAFDTQRRRGESATLVERVSV